MKSRNRVLLDKRMREKRELDRLYLLMEDRRVSKDMFDGVKSDYELRWGIRYKSPNRRLNYGLV